MLLIHIINDIDEAGGAIIVSLMVFPDGSIDKVKIIISTLPNLDKKAVSIVKKYNHWKPAVFEGKAIEQEVYVPLCFPRM